MAGSNTGRFYLNYVKLIMRDCKFRMISLSLPAMNKKR